MRPSVEAHPRVSGENYMDGLRGYNDGGSSPRERGKPHISAGFVDPGWLIPA